MLKTHPKLAFDFVSTLHGTDYGDYLEIYVHLFSFEHHQSVAIKVKIDKESPQIESLVALWPGANWPEREVFDLLGIAFLNHPNLKRILLPEEWEGHPLRKDYEPYDVEV
ncbi:NADH-quinone oxidoreductase subunit C [Bacillus carboniphilus]|uniref:NADH-quinone oxidoreductase n=1 Tax=Bacillus carboniphilus TaxID=86663 RepID=A0ABY9K0G4_9BACI|nr:NADH-quinone oxidoreductase subunit C [Bacillus carboniphilus]WLR44327.1 NADH-quinone oxidoreductase subunit C [Bacillus carboniphilus]